MQDGSGGLPRQTHLAVHGWARSVLRQRYPTHAPAPVLRALYLPHVPSAVACMRESLIRAASREGSGCSAHLIIMCSTALFCLPGALQPALLQVPVIPQPAGSPREELAAIPCGVGL